MNLLRITLAPHRGNRRSWSPGISPAIDPTADLHHGGIAITLPGQPWSLLVTRAGAEPLRLRPLALRSRLLVNHRRVVNRLTDARASVAGYCNDIPYRGEPGLGGGYAFWRCALPAGPGLHRARNYVWDADGKTEFLPLPAGARSVEQPWDRHNVLTRRQRRAKEAFHRRCSRQVRSEAVDRG